MARIVPQANRRSSASVGEAFVLFAFPFFSSQSDKSEVVRERGTQSDNEVSAGRGESNKVSLEAATCRANPTMYLFDCGKKNQQTTHKETGPRGQRKKELEEFGESETRKGVRLDRCVSASRAWSARLAWRYRYMGSSPGECLDWVLSTPYLGLERE